PSRRYRPCSLFFYFVAHATPVIYTLSLHDALPISLACQRQDHAGVFIARTRGLVRFLAARDFDPRPLPPQIDPAGSQKPYEPPRDRKSTRLNSSHVAISYAVFCLKKKKPQMQQDST